MPLQQGLVDRQGVEIDSGILDAGQSPSPELLERGANSSLLIRARRPRQDLPNELRGIIDQYTGGLPMSIAQYPAAGRIRRVFRNARTSQYFGVHPGRVAIDSFQNNRVSRTDGIELSCRRKNTGPPKTLVPALTDYPSILRRDSRGLRNFRQDVGLR